MLPQANSYDALRRAFRWDVPARCNIAVDCCDRHADGGAADRVAPVPDAAATQQQAQQQQGSADR